MSQRIIEREQSRKDNFKQGIRDGDGTMKRTEMATQTQKERRAIKLAKRRQRPSTHDNPYKGKSLEKSTNMLPECIKQIFSPDLKIVLKGLSGLAVFSLSPNKILLERMSAERIITQIVKIASTKKGECVQHVDKAFTVISNILFTLNITEMLLEKTNIASVVLNIIQTQTSPLILKNGAMFVISNIIGDRETKYRDEFIKQGVAKAICQNLQFVLKQNPLPELAIEFRSNLLWAISNCYDGATEPDFNALEAAGADKLVIRSILTMEDEDVIIACLLTLYNATRYSNIQKSVLMNEKLVKRIFELVQHRLYSIQKRAIKTVGNLSSFPEMGQGKFSVGDILINYGVSDAILFCLQQSANELKEEGTFVASNLVSGLPRHLNFLWEKKVIATVIENAFQGTTRVRNESTRCITDAFRTSLNIRSNDERLVAINRLLSRETLKVLNCALKSPNGKVALDAIDCCWCMIKSMKKQIIGNFEESGILETVMELTMASTHTTVNTKAENFQAYLDNMLEGDGELNEEYADFLGESGDISNFMQVARRGNQGCDYMFETDACELYDNVEMDIDSSEESNNNNNNNNINNNENILDFANPYVNYSMW